MSHACVWIHAVWETKYRKPVLTDATRSLLLAHVRENAHQKGILIDRLKGHTDHLHCLFALNADMSVSKAMQLMKGESAHWLNKEDILPGRFEWANEYYAASVGKSEVDRVRWYIDNQGTHHRRNTFAQEIEILMQEQVHHG